MLFKQQMNIGHTRHENLSNSRQRGQMGGSNQHLGIAKQHFGGASFDHLFRQQIGCLGIPETCWEALSESWRRRAPDLLARFDLAFDGRHVAEALRQLRPVLDDCGWIWGVSGSVGFELASGFIAMHAASDLDLILRTPQLITRNQARKLVAVFDQAVCRVDLQLQTPFGAVALREWAGGSARVLLKNEYQAGLVTDPWNPQEQAA